MEFLYKRIVGPLNPKTPIQSLKVQIFWLKVIGLYPPDDESKLIQTLYTIYATGCRFFFLYLFSFFQLLFFVQISNIREVADALFMFMTEICLIYKTQIYFNNRFRLRNCVRRLESCLFLPQNAQDELIFRNAMLIIIVMLVTFVSSPVFFISGTALSSLFQRKLLVPSWYFGYDATKDKSILNYVLVWLFQVIGLAGGAAMNVIYDPTAVALLLLGKCQLDRLGLIIEKIGHEVKEDPSYEKPELNNEMIEIGKEVALKEKSNGKHYAQLVECIISHKKILEFLEELEEIHKDTLFIQFIFSSLIICMTMVITAELKNVAEIIPFMAYLLGMVLQIYLYCWTASEITAAVKFMIKFSP